MNTRFLSAFQWMYLLPQRLWNLRVCGGFSEQSVWSVQTVKCTCLYLLSTESLQTFPTSEWSVPCSAGQLTVSAKLFTFTHDVTDPKIQNKTEVTSRKRSPFSTVFFRVLLLPSLAFYFPHVHHKIQKKAVCITSISVAVGLSFSRADVQI